MKRLLWISLIYLLLGGALGWLAVSIGFLADDWVLLQFDTFSYRTLFTTSWIDHPDSRPFYRPLILLSLYWNYILSGGDPGPFHAFNVLVHVLNSALVLVLYRAFFPEQGDRPALLASLLFFVLPIHTDSIFWVSARTDTVCAVFYLMSAVFFLRYLSNASPRLFLATLLSFWGALLSKEIVFALPGVLILLAAYRRRLRSRETWYLLACVLISYLGYFLIRRLVLGTVLAAEPHTSFSLAGIQAYLGNLYFVFSSGKLTPLDVCVPGALLMMALVQVRNRPIRRDFSYFLLLYLVALVPMVALTMRWYLYIPSAFICILAVRLWFADLDWLQLSKRKCRLFAVVGVSCGALGLLAALGQGRVLGLNSKYLSVPALIFCLFSLRVWFGYPDRLRRRAAAGILFAGLLIFYGGVLVSEGVSWRRTSEVSEDYLDQLESQLAHASGRALLVNVPMALSWDATGWAKAIFPVGPEQAVRYRLGEGPAGDIVVICRMWLPHAGEVVSTITHPSPDSYTVKCSKGAAFWFNEDDQPEGDISVNRTDRQLISFRVKSREGDRILFFDGVSLSPI